MHKLNPIYEKDLVINDVLKLPDFTIEDSDSGINYYWEHCGMMNNSEYRTRWEEKLSWYKENDILPWEEGGGENGVLVVTTDSEKGAISVPDIDKIIKKVFLNDKGCRLICFF